MSDAQADEKDVYVERWEQALRVLEAMTPHERERHFDMGSWGAKTDCGTVACLAGHCSLDPWFQERRFVGTFGEFKQFNGDVIHPLHFTEIQPRDFFGRRGYEDIFLDSSASYDAVVGAVRCHIEFLRAGGDPDEWEEPSDFYEGSDDDYF